MYRIIRIKDGVELGTTDAPFYIKYGQSGDLTPAAQQDAIGVSFNGVVYNLHEHTDIEDADQVVISEIDGGAYMMVQKRIVAGLVSSILEG